MHKILVAGDSHSIILGNNVVSTDPSKVSRFPGVEVLHLGPALAYTLPLPSSLNAGPRLIEHIAARPDEYDSLMLCFGEIDARAHLVKQAVLHGLSLRAAVDQLVDHYFRFIDELVQRFGLAVFVWGPVGTMPDHIDFYNPDYPTVGTEQERNQATVLLHRALAARCETHAHAHYVSIAPQLVGPDLRTAAVYYEDGVHLNRKGLSLALVEIRRRLAELGFGHIAERFPEQVFCADEASLRDVSARASIVHLSSTQDPLMQAGMPITNPRNLPFIFHTELEDRPRVVIDLGCVQMVKHIEIHNRRDGFQDRAASLSVGLSTNRYSFANAYRSVHRQVFGADGKPLVLSFDTPGHFRYLQLELEERNHFHLAQIKVWAMSFLNPL